MMMGSITAGADHLRLSQPAVTRLIRDLERSLDLSLFERERGRVRPTSAALALVREIDDADEDGNVVRVEEWELAG